MVFILEWKCTVGVIETATDRAAVEAIPGLPVPSLFIRSLESQEITVVSETSRLKMKA